MTMARASTSVFTTEARTSLLSDDGPRRQQFINSVYATWTIALVSKSHNTQILAGGVVEGDLTRMVETPYYDRVSGLVIRGVVIQHDIIQNSDVENKRVRTRLTD